MTVNTKTQKVLILGAGISGLSCARELQARGIRVRVLERSQVPGGRCAHRDGFDFGPIFIHGTTEEFLSLKTQAPPGEILEGWPRIVMGAGKPCQPSAFQPGSLRWACRSGMGVLSRQLADGLDVRLGFQAERIIPGQEYWTAVSQEGREEYGTVLVLALAPEQSAHLLAALNPEDLLRLGSPQALLNLFSTVPSLTLRTRINRENFTAVPDWDVFYPEKSTSILLVSRETSKRPSPGGTEDFVIQARPAWSAQWISTGKEAWAGELLDAARQLLGFSGQPEESSAHRWKYARLEPGHHLARSWLSPPSTAVPRLAVTGELFHPAGGVEGAYLAGKALAEDLFREKGL